MEREREREREERERESIEKESRERERVERERERERSTGAEYPASAVPCIIRFKGTKIPSFTNDGCLVQHPAEHRLFQCVAYQPVDDKKDLL